jgi:hypothetical protein
MIRLSKKTIPAVLAANSSTWTRVLLDHQAANTTPTSTEKSRYRHADIKAALVEETSGKCAYCESKLRHITYGDIEHISPKSLDVGKTFEWENLTLACDVCNTNKSVHFGNHEDLVDPYVLEPLDHLEFLGATVLSRPGSTPGLITESTLDLNRAELLERRRDRLSNLCKQLHLIVEVTDLNKKDVLRRDLRREMQDDKEYAALARAYIPQQLSRLDDLSTTSIAS